ncbi:MAG: nicotinate-nucleotide adenylyltransferase, nicotinate-nucleotide adenylyltransferase [Candidatus Levybacteria bacterium]|nr:nicotinate-nucleotide adenylyltransferase, nicotinate-nucleotide adenylyltransferase [Candidatus Levybacteria bacterium]
MKIAILGGSFDPPHNGHVAIANRLLKLLNFDQVWLMPCYQHPFNKNLSAPNIRFEMTKFLENALVKVSDLEIKKKTISYSIDALKFLAKTRPQDNFSWIIGTDQVGSFTKWKNWQKIIDNFQLIIVPRTEYEKAEKQLQNIKTKVSHPENIFLIDRKNFPPIYISSRLIRQEIKESKSISNMVPKNVEKYIIQGKLYR